MPVAWCRWFCQRCWADCVDGKLVFSAAPDGTGRLVFGAQDGGAVVVPGAALSLDAGASLPGLGALTLRTGKGIRIDATLPGLDGPLGLLWGANVSRGGLRAALHTGWQTAAPVASSLLSPWQQAVPLRRGIAARWQPAQPQSARLRAAWQEAERLRSVLASHWQQGNPLRAAARTHWQDTERLRAVLASHWQQGEPLRAATRTHWQAMLRLRAAVRGHWQPAGPLRATTGAAWGAAAPVYIHLHTHWQTAMRPHSGVSPRPTQPPARPPCYDPATLGRLVFADAWAGNGRLVFVCDRGGPPLPPAGIVVPAQRTYIVINSVEIRRADNLAGDPLPSESFQMSLNHQSWTWTFSAAFHASARDAVAPGPGGQPVELEVRINGQPFRLQAERIGRSKRFPGHQVTVSGRGRAALLDAPHAPVQTFGHTLDRTAQQLMQDVLTVGGVGFGWSVDWQLTDWLVPANVWMHRGTWSSALADIAGSVGGYLQPHDTDPVLHVLPRWVKPWWEWDALAPDFDLPAGIAEVENTEVVDLPGYNRIFVRGESLGVFADLTRSGTAGDVLHDNMVVHPLITTIGAARQRATAELSESGRMLKHKMTLPILPATGVIKPGAVLRYADDDAVQRLGLVRATSISMQWPVLTQALEIDSHV